MKFKLLIVLLTTITSCNSVNSEKSEINDAPKSELERNYEIADLFLESDAEKIGLLSMIKGVSSETTYSVLRDYTAKTFMSESFLLNEDPKLVVKLVDSIAVKNNLTRELTASIIFSYQYEMITHDEIIEDYFSDQEIYYDENY